jgi:DNA-binding protein YbaB
LLISGRIFLYLRYLYVTMINPGKLLKMQKEAKEMQKKLRERKVSGASKSDQVKIFMNAAQEFEDVFIDDSLLYEGGLDDIKKGMKEAFKDYQKKLQKEMMKDMDLDQLKGMLG